MHGGPISIDMKKWGIKLFMEPEWEIMDQKSHIFSLLKILSHYEKFSGQVVSHWCAQGTTPHIEEVEILTLSLPVFKPWTLVPTLQVQNQLSYAYAGCFVVALAIGAKQIRSDCGRGARSSSEVEPKSREKPRQKWNNPP
ncbi:hypothetical protein M9H77_08667 [Catharanthus roseus]|uniref:Uncharacterized protein n=1 Tax=Catharanthus roseus TaxID=4058 RepID=A0ACC0BYM4_CATRO|nr:hypothetical protein M9H77_08667 [Catharanthus roseus]